MRRLASGMVIWIKPSRASRTQSRRAVESTQIQAVEQADRMPPATPPNAAAESAAANFIRNIVDDDLARGKYAARKWGGHPGTAAAHQAGAPDPARIRTRFPPEPNGYLHIGHAKSICLNFGLARDYGGVCHMRFDDTNPTREEQEYVDSIQDAVKWLGFDWGQHLYFASDYFDLLYAFAEKLIEAGHAYVDSVSAEEMRSLRGTLTEPGRDSPYRSRTPAENLELFRRMKAGEFADHRPLYDWLNQRLAELGQLNTPLPQQIEFARLNLTYTVLSKRKLVQLVEEKHVDAWDDPRMPTLVGARRRGFTPEAMRLFAERIGVAKAHSIIDMSILEDCVREDLNERAPRAFAVLDPLRLVIDNWPKGHVEQAEAPVHPHHPELGKRSFPISGELWIEREDFAETPPKGYFRLFPGNMVRLRFGYVVKCIGADKDAAGNVVAVHCEYLPETRSGTPGSDSVKVKGNIHWLSAAHACEAEVRLYDRLFNVPFPGARRGRDVSDDTLQARESLAGAEEQEPGAAPPPEDFHWLDDLNPDSKRTLRAYVEPGLSEAAPETRFQFERHGYFVADLRDTRPGKPVFNRAVTLRDSWAKQAK